MPEPSMLKDFIDGADVDGAVLELRPDYRAMLVAVDGLMPGPGDRASEELLRAAGTAAGEALRDRPADQLPHVAAWREAYRAFRAEPQRTRYSLIAPLTRLGPGVLSARRLIGGRQHHRDQP